MTLRNILVLEEKPLYQVFFLKNDRYQSVFINETEEIDFAEIKEHLRKGESIFIAGKQKPLISHIKKSTKKSNFAVKG